jgi:S-adenosylmethionine synthetase
MRTTITLDPDTEALVKTRMREGALTFKQVVNDAIRRGLAAPAAADTSPMPTFRMGESAVPLDKAMRFAADLEDDELLRRMSVGR